MADEKDEKFDEKDMEKREEKSSEEKHWDEKYRRDPLGPVIWGLILVWAGGVFLAQNLGLLDQWFGLDDAPLWLRDLMDGWSLVWLGAGALLLLGVLIRLVVPAYRQPVAGQIIAAMILIGIGLGDLVSWTLVWPLVLIGAGLILVVRSLMRRT